MHRKEQQEKEESKTAELPKDIPGQTEIEKEFPELLPEPVKMPEIQKKEPDCTGTMQESEPSVEKAVDNSGEIQESAINTEAGRPQEQVDNSKKQDSAGSRWEYMKTMGTYAAALYMAASMKKMPHMMLGSAEYWQKWLETEVGKNGQE